MLNTKTVHIALFAIAAIALLAGCSAEQPSPAGPPAGAEASAGAGQHQQHNQADIAFAQEMIPHHQQAIAMAEMVPDRSTNQEVIELAEQINTAQGPEIATMQQWLRQWGTEQPNPMNGGGMGSMDHGDMGGMDHGGMGDGGKQMTGMGMPGMMSGQQMTQLRNAQGAAFDRMWLQMMITHHEGAVEMATQERRAGTNPDAKNLAGTIINTQQREITTMNGLLERT